MRDISGRSKSISENTFTNLNFKQTGLFEKPVEHNKEGAEFEDDLNQVTNRMGIPFQTKKFSG